ncbi:hypothetical protein HMPREF9946_03105 [Acetobacteraceae bacterium AT-5844]|nr:hypothetical protein HMPREF9946_03105 [Acetobacteraceae bacterium AT-5844]
MSTKFMIARIGYRDYAVSFEDATALLAIASRSLEVKQDNYRGPYIPVEAKDDEGENSFVEQLRLGAVKQRQAETDEPFVDPAAPSKPEPLAIGHTPKLSPPEPEMPF